MIFDNAFPDGILKEDYLKQIAGSSPGSGIVEGAELLKNYAKPVN